MEELVDVNFRITLDGSNLCNSYLSFFSKFKVCIVRSYQVVLIDTNSVVSFLV